MLTPLEVEQFDKDGVTLIEGPFSPEQIEATAAAIDRLHRIKDVSITDYVQESDLLDVIQHPFLENVAKQALRANEVEFVGFAPLQKDPVVGEKSVMEGEHVDVAYAPSDLRAEPRRMLASVLVWFSDVAPDNGPMMIRPGSHHQIADHFGEPVPGSDGQVAVNELPELPFAEPVPILAQAGQVSLLTTATLHSASVNVGDKPRRVLFTVWQAKGVDVTFDVRRAASRAEWLAEMRKHFRPERQYLIPASNCEDQD